MSTEDTSLLGDSIPLEPTKASSLLGDSIPLEPTKASLLAELEAMKAIALALEPLSRPERARALLAAALQFSPIPMDFDHQLHLLRVANGAA